MRKSRLTETQIIGILKAVEAGSLVKDVCREHSISDATDYQWKSKYGGMEAADIKRLKDPEEENRIHRRLHLTRFITFDLSNVIGRHSKPAPRRC